MTLPKWQREHICSCPTDEEDCNYKKALVIVVEALEKISKDQEFATLRKVWYIEEAKRTLAKIEAIGESK